MDITGEMLLNKDKEVAGTLYKVELAESVRRAKNPELPGINYKLYPWAKGLPAGLYFLVDETECKGVMEIVLK